eukprot:6403265-Alexandrium_andersonii.AAC.1
MSVPANLRLVTDSQAVYGRLLSFIAQEAECPFKPPSLHEHRPLYMPSFVNATDGDVWQMLRCAVHARGPEAL